MNNNKKLQEETMQGLKTFTTLISKDVIREYTPPKQGNNPRDRRNEIQGIGDQTQIEWKIKWKGILRVREDSRKIHIQGTGKQPQLKPMMCFR